MISKNYIYKPFGLEFVSDAYIGWLNDKEVNRFSLRRFVKTNKEDAFIFISNLKSNEYMYAIIADGDKHIGNIHLGPVDEFNHNAEIRLIIGEKIYWNKGVATEAIYAATKFLFEEKNVHRVGADSCNPAFGRVVVNKLGWRYEGAMKERMLIDNHYHDYHIYGLLNTEFKRIKEFEI